MARSRILHGDCLRVLRRMESESIQMCATSPPYWGLRDYGVSGQLGLEKTPDEYVGKMVEVFREVRRVLAKDGTLWLNLGDSYAQGGSGGASPKSTLRSGAGVSTSEKLSQMHGKSLSRSAPAGLKPKDLVGIPWRVAFALQADGWYLRSDIIWHKPNPMPESITDRPTKAHEYLFLLTKSARYFYDHEAIKEPAVSAGQQRLAPAGWGQGDEPRSAIELQKAGIHRKSAKQGSFAGKTGERAFRAVTATRNKRTVWRVGSSPFPNAHFATFPPALIEPCILAGSGPGDLVLDPFNGAGTTGVVAKKHGRDYVGIELNREYIDMARARIRAARPARSPEARA